MKLVIKCQKCKDDLEVTDSYPNQRDEIVIVIEPCARCTKEIPDTHGKCSDCIE